MNPSLSTSHFTGVAATLPVHDHRYVLCAPQLAIGALHGAANDLAFQISTIDEIEKEGGASKARSA